MILAPPPERSPELRNLDVGGTGSSPMEDRAHHCAASPRLLPMKVANHPYGTEPLILHASAP